MMLIVDQYQLLDSSHHRWLTLARAVLTHSNAE